MRQALKESLDNLNQMGLDKLLEARYQRLMSYGQFSE
jgi:acetyl-CoA carboxylase alpha subunit